MIRRFLAFALLLFASPALAFDAATYGAAIQYTSTKVYRPSMPANFLTAWGTDYVIAPTLTYSADGSALGASGYNPKASAAYTAALAGTNYYVESAGSDSNLCTSAGAGNACLSIWGAVSKCNAGTKVCYIHVKGAQTYRTTSNFSAIVSTNVPSAGSKIIYECYGGGPCVSSVYAALTWAADTANTNLYWVTRTLVGRVFDRTTKDANGNYREFTKVTCPAQAQYQPWSFSAPQFSGVATTAASGDGATATISFAAQSCAPEVGTQITVAGVTPSGFNGTFTITASTTTSASWAAATTGPQTVAGTVTYSGLMVNRGDQAAVTDTNTHVLLQATNFVITTTSGQAQSDIFITSATPLDSWEFEGGTNNGGAGASILIGYNATNDGTKHLFYVENARFYGSGIANDNTNGAAFSTTNMNGLLYVANSDFSGEKSDGVSCTDTGLGGGARMLSINNRGRGNGVRIAQSANGFTAHDDCVVVSIADEYWDGAGGTFMHINASKSWIIGGRGHLSRGDIIYGGSQQGSEFRVSDTAEMWCDRCVADPGPAGNAFQASDTAKIHLREPIYRGRLNAASGATIDTY